MARRQHLTLTVVFVLSVFFLLSYLFSGPSGAARTLEREQPMKQPPVAARSDFSIDMDAISTGILADHSIAPKLENKTAKAILGRSTWHFLHTMMARFPEKPTEDERKTLELFMQLFGRLYPCGDCATHFRGLMADYPPQTSSRNAAAGWLCFAHNIVNKRLHKPEFDCTTIGDFYDCGCGGNTNEGEESQQELSKE